MNKRSFLMRKNFESPAPILSCRIMLPPRETTGNHRLLWSLLYEGGQFNCEAPWLVSKFINILAKLMYMHRLGQLEPENQTWNRSCETAVNTEVPPAWTCFCQLRCRRSSSLLAPGRLPNRCVEDVGWIVPSF